MLKQPNKHSWGVLVMESYKTTHTQTRDDCIDCTIAEAVCGVRQYTRTKNDVPKQKKEERMSFVSFL